MNFALKVVTQSSVKVGIDCVKFEYSSRTVGVEFAYNYRVEFAKSWSRVRATFT